MTRSTLVVGSLVWLALAGCSDPSAPVDAAVPDVLAVPDLPAVLDTPAVPDTPAALDTPAVPDTPATLDTPAVLDTPAAPDVPADVPPPFDSAADHAAITQGVRTITLGSALASPLVVHGPTAFPVVYDDRGVTFIAAARADRGTVAAYGHEALANAPNSTADDRGALLRNLVRWMARGRADATVGYQGSRDAVRDFLRAAGYTVRTATPATLDGLDVMIVDAGTQRTADEVARLHAWVRAGGGLIVTGHAWYWGYSNTDAYNNHPGNQLLNALGLTLTTDTDAAQTLVTVRPPTALEHAARALAAVRDHLRSTASLTVPQQVRASDTVRRAVRVMDVGSPYFTEVRALRTMLPDVIPTAQSPVRPATMPLPALTVVIDMRLAAALPVAMLRAHPAAVDFPGAVEAAAVTVTRTVQARYAGRSDRIGGNSDRPVWRPLGLYAPPGAQVTVTVPAAVAADGRLDLQVGAHTDDNTGTEAWTRVPAIVRRFALRTAETTVGNAFGGMLYLRVPAGVDLGAVAVTVRGAVEAPHYVHGVTTLEAWRATVRNAPAPWAELETDKLALTVPAAIVRTLDDPRALMTYWDRVMDADADLAAIDRARPRAERIVFDRQIVAGYMHAGYPILAHVPQAAEALDLTALTRTGNWGFFHELGHNHQFADWGWSGTGEATVNLWSVYAMQHVVGLAPRSGHPAITPAQRAERLRTYIAGGRNFSRDWSVWLALETFLQLQEGFGWELLTRLNREYLALAQGERPRDQAAQIQRWIVRSAVTANRNLVPFYTAWGFPITAETRAATASLPVWAEDPMR